jgi:hypothetical protein
VVIRRKAMQLYDLIFLADGKRILTMPFNLKVDLKHKEYFDFTAKLFQWRKKPLQFTQIKYIPESNVYTYFRYNDDNTVMIVLNNKESIKLSTKRFAENIQKTC